MLVVALLAGVLAPMATATPATAQERSTDGLLALYDFAQGSGRTVADVSGSASPVDLVIDDPSRVTWTDDGLRLDRPTRVTSMGSTAGLTAPMLTNRAYTLEVWFEAAADQSTDARIVELSSSFSDVGLVLEQRPYSSAPNRLEARTRTGDTNRRGVPGVRTPRRSLPDRLVHVVVTHRPDGTTLIYQDGVQVGRRDLGTLSRWRLPAALRLGGSTDGRGSWVGEYRLLALYDRALTAAEVTANHAAGPDLPTAAPPTTTTTTTTPPPTTTTTVPPTTTTVPPTTTTTVPPTTTTVPPTTTTVPPTTTTTVPPTTGTVPAPPRPDDDWWTDSHDLRIPIEVAIGDADRTDDHVEVAVDLEVVSAEFDGDGPTLRPDTLRLVEIDDDGGVVDPAVPFQFDPAPDADGPLVGELVVRLPGRSAAGTTRRFHLYVDTSGRELPPAPVPSSVSLAEGVDEGVDALEITTPSGTWWYDEAGGGFSSLRDGDGADWIGWSSADRSAGEFRGIPNLVFPEGHFHPGFESSTTNVVATGPLRTTLRSSTPDGWSMTWQVTADRAVGTVEEAPRGYWFLYEGTPGGLAEADTDEVVRAGGLTTTLATSWTGDLPGDEWVAFRDGGSGRALLLTNRTADDAVDSYRLMNDEMTVFGFGRVNTSSSLTGTPRSFTVELLEPGADIDAAAAAAVRPPVAQALPTETRPTVPGEPTAIIDADLVLGGAPLAVALDGSDSVDDGAVADHVWDLGTDAATGPTTTATYGAPDTEVVALTVTDDEGLTSTSRLAILVTGDPPAPPNEPPTAVAVAAPNLGGPPLSATLDDRSTDIDGAVTTASWDLGDGTTATGTTVEHTYAAAGVYVVTLTVTDDDGATSTTSTAVTVRDHDGGTGSRISDGLVALYDLDEGTGARVLDRIGGHDLTIAEPASTTWVPGGLRIDAPTMITNPDAATSITGPVSSGGEVTVEAWIETASTTQNGPARIVTLSDGARDRNVTLGQGVFRSAGDRIDARVRTTSTDDNGRPSLSTAVGTLTTDLTHVAVTRSADGTTRIYLDGVLRASGTAGGSLAGWDPTYRLVLGNETDGDRAWLGTLHLVALYSRALSADEVGTNHAAGPSGDDELPNRAPIVSLGSTTTSGEAPLDVVLDASGSVDPDGTIVAYAWDLGDGTTSTAAAVAHSYTEPGTYDATLTVTDDDGRSATDSITIIVTEPDAEDGGGTGGGGTSGPVDWRAVSSSTGDLPLPPQQPDQTMSTIFDVDGDGADDIVLGGRRGASGPSIVWYRFDGSTWTRRTIEPDLLRIEAGGTFGDVDGDGDLDLIAGEDLRGERLFWWENPAPDLDRRWTRWVIKDSGGTQHHDQVFGDVDGDGEPELVFWNQRDGGKLFLAEVPADPTTGPWTFTSIFQPATTGEGLALADIDGDGVLDIVGGGHWLRHESGTKFTAFPVDAGRTSTQVAVGQLIDGGRPEIVLDSGDFDGPLTVHEWDGTGWRPTVIDTDSRHGHSVDIGDVNGDGHLDIMSGEMALNGVTDPELKVFYGDGDGGFTEQLVSVGAEVHDSGLGDFDGDGDPDIAGKPFRIDVPRLDVWWNDGAPLLAVDDWSRSVADDSVPWRTIFVEYGDIDGDGLDDVISGGWWWRNPGTVDGTWTRAAIGAPLNQMAVVHDFDGDGDLDVLGTEAEGSRPNARLRWAENDGTGDFTVRANVDAATGRFLQGAIVVELQPGVLEVALSWEDGQDGLQVITVPAPTAVRTDRWTRRIAHPSVFGEELSAADVDGDGDIDLFDGEAWYRNDAASLDRFVIQTLRGDPDRNRLVDVDGDGDLDAVVGFAHDPDGKVRWFEQGTDPTAPWTPHVIGDVGPSWAASLDVADLDGDGDVDVVVGEHDNPDPGGLAVIVFEQANADTWTRHTVQVGDEHHDGTQLADLDGDGDLDLVSIGWTHRRLHLYENLAR